MNNPKYQVGQKVWLEVRVTSVDPVEVEIDRYLDPTDQRIPLWPGLDDIRTADDFKDPLDQAIIDAALEVAAYDVVKDWNFEHGQGNAPYRRLLDAVHAKLDVTRPVTAEGLINLALLSAEPDAERRASMASAVAYVLRGEGLLNEPEL